MKLPMGGVASTSKVARRNKGAGTVGGMDGSAAMALIAARPSAPKNWMNEFGTGIL